MLLELTMSDLVENNLIKIVQRNAMQAWKENSSFYDKIVFDKKITKKIPVNKIKNYLILVTI